MDEADSYIIERMTENARISFRKIAKELRVSTDTIIKRYKRLQERGVIRGSTVVVNPKKIGYNGMTVFMINVSPTHITEKDSTPSESAKILETLIRMPNIILATKTVGDYDLLAIGVARDFDHLISTGDDIAKIPGVRDLQVSFWSEKMELCSKYFVV